MILLAALFLSSCSESVYRAAQKPPPTSTRYKVYNEPIHAIGANMGTATLSSRFTGVRESDMLAGDKTSFYLENMRFTMGGYYRVGMTPNFGLQMGLDFYQFSGTFGLSPAERSQFQYMVEGDDSLPAEAWVIGNVEDNFFEGFFEHQAFVPLTANSVQRFENNVWSFSFLPYYYLPLFEDRPQQMPNAKRVFVYGGMAGNIITPRLTNMDNQRISKEEGESVIESTFGFSLPLGIGFSWRINRDLAVEYSVDYRTYLGNHASGVADTRSDDRQFGGRLGVSYRIR